MYYSVVKNDGSIPSTNDPVLAGLPAAREIYRKLLESSTEPKSFLEKRREDAGQLADAFKRHLLPEVNRAVVAVRNLVPKTNLRYLFVGGSTIGFVMIAAAPTATNHMNYDRNNAPAGLANPFDTPQTMSLEQWNETFGNGEKNISIIPKASAAVMPVTLDRSNRYEKIEYGPVQIKTVKMGELSGREMGNLNTLYTGIDGKAPTTARINYLANLERMYQSKLKIDGVSGATKKAAPEIISRYKERRTLTNLSTYTSDIQSRINANISDYDFDGLCSQLKVDFKGGTEGCKLLTAVAPKITGEHFVGISFTEIMPKQKEGLFNARLYDHLLRTGGIEYISSIPALGDTYLSVGGWQFTSFAVRVDASGAHGASIASRFAAKEHQIPDSVVLLEREDHDRAAFFFSLYNISNLIGCPLVPTKKNPGPEDWKRDCATKAERAAFRKLISTPEGVDQVAQYLAIAHHNPTWARKRTRTWLGKGMPGNLRDHQGPKLTIYARKTHNNLLGLRKFLKSEAKGRS